MRKHLLFALLGMVAMFTSCSQEDNLGNQSTGKVTSFTLAVDDGVKTRADVTEPTEKPTRYIMEVYEATTSVGATQATQVVQTTNTFNITLKDGQDYTILFWADYSDGVFDASKLREVKINTGKVATKAAFAGVAKFKVGTDDASVYTAVTLKHAVAQVKFSQTGALTATPSKLTVKYPESYSLNVEGYATTTITGAVTHELACNAVTTGVIATDYIIASNADNALMNIEATLDNEAKKDISNAPFRRDYTTTISGAYSDKYSATLTISCDNTWVDNETEIVPPVNGFAIGDYYPLGATKDNAEGVVFWVNPDDATKGKIVSMDESSQMLWTLLYRPITGATSITDGASNTEMIKNLENYSDENFAAIAWCLSHGEGWYMPAQNELIAIYEAWNADQAGFNSKLTTAISAVGYWSSTEKIQANAMAVYFTRSVAVPNDKYTQLNIRAIFAF